jgi:hypothetical protein
MKKACSIVLIAVVCIIGIFALMNYKNANDTKENSEADIYKTSEYQEIIKGSYLAYEEKFDKNGNAYLYDDENKKKVKPSIEASVIYYDDISSKYNNITYNVIDDNPWYGAHARFICTLSDRNDVIVEEF